MEQDKLKKLIVEKNERRERDTLRTAEAIIDSIAAEQRHIKESEKKIAELRKELTELSVDVLDPKALLGEA